MPEISNLYGNFHDWLLERIIVRGSENRRHPDTLILGLFDDQEGFVSATFNGMTRLGIEGGGALNIVNCLEIVEPDADAFDLAQTLLSKSAHGERRGRYVAYLYSTVGAEIAVEFDEVTIATEKPTP
ncbi:hypothetical protein CR51_35445 [Caballeronia megalochromosomata]|jgi:hypothetical protein|nr:hypothetical protein CR51_35445 [Caballeronia megalochromosomata]